VAAERVRHQLAADLPAWLGIDGTEDNTFTYDPANLPAAPGLQPFVVGAENLDGTASSSIAGLPTATCG
jgi:hypothetical protein